MPFKLMFVTVLLASCAAALWKGRDSERTTAAVLLFAAVASPFAETSGFLKPESGILIIDGLLLAYLLWLALRSDRFWPLWAAAFQVVGTLVHIARFTDGSVWPNAYATGQVIWSYPVLMALAAGCWLEAQYRER